MPTKPATKITPSDAANKNDFHRVVGKAMYAKLFDPAKPAPAYADTIPVKWTVDVLIDNATKAKLQGVGMGFGKENALYKEFVASNGLDKQGYDGTYIRVSKNVTKKAWDANKGMVKTDAAGNPITEPAKRPAVVDSGDTEIPFEAYEKGFAIGNGSEVEVTFTITKPSIGGFGKFGSRLIRTKILDLVKYTPKKGSFVFDDMEDSLPFSDDPAILN